MVSFIVKLHHTYILKVMPITLDAVSIVMTRSGLFIVMKPHTDPMCTRQHVSISYLVLVK